MEGTFAAERMIPSIENTIYVDVESAIKAKQKLVDSFEKDFGYTREAEEFDRNYSYNCGMLDALNKHLMDEV